MGKYYPYATEIGRFARVSLDKRECKMCTNTDKDIEEVIHFLFTNDLYDNLRQILFKKIVEATHDFTNMLILVKLKNFL